MRIVKIVRGSNHLKKLSETFYCFKVSTVYLQHPHLFTDRVGLEKSYLMVVFKKKYIIIQQVFTRQNLNLPTFYQILFCHRLLYIMFGKIFSNSQRPPNIAII